MARIVPETLAPVIETGLCEGTVRRACEADAFGCAVRSSGSLPAGNGRT